MFLWCEKGIENFFFYRWSIEICKELDSKETIPKIWKKKTSAYYFAYFGYLMENWKRPECAVNRANRFDENYTKQKKKFHFERTILCLNIENSGTTVLQVVTKCGCLHWHRLIVQLLLDVVVAVTMTNKQQHQQLNSIFGHSHGIWRSMFALQLFYLTHLD